MWPAGVHSEQIAWAAGITLVLAAFSGLSPSCASPAGSDTGDDDTRPVGEPVRTASKADASPLSDGGLCPLDAGGRDEDMLSSFHLEDSNSAPVEYVLMLGFDRSGKLPGRTDSIMIVAARHETGELGVMSVPRDLWVEIPGWEPGRINKVYRVGEMLHGVGGGQDLMKRVIRAELGIAIDYVAAVDFAGFAKVVDLLGGIDIDVACPIKDNFISPKSETGYVPLSLDSGRQRIDGATALLFSRSRHGRSDMDRARRQQAVLMGLKEKAMRLDVIPRLPLLLGAVKKHVETDVDLAGAFRLADLARRCDAASLHGLVIREPIVYEWRSPEGQSVVKLNRQAFDKALAGLFDAPMPGLKERQICQPADVALRWKELAKTRKERLRRERRSEQVLGDAGVDAED